MVYPARGMISASPPTLSLSNSSSPCSDNNDHLRPHSYPPSPKAEVLWHTTSSRTLLFFLFAIKPLKERFSIGIRHLRL